MTMQIIKEHKLEVARIVILAVLSGLFSLSVIPFPVFLAGLVFGLFGLAKEGIAGLFKERKIGTEIYITIAVIVAVLGKEYLAAGIILLIILIAEFIGDVISERARTSIRSLIDEMPKNARLKHENGKEEMVEIEKLKTGNVVLIKTGEKIPVDGKVIHGNGAVNQAAITGENMPQEKNEGSEVYAGTVLQAGALDIRVTKLSGDTLFSHIIALVEEAQEKRAPIQKLTDKVATYLIPISFVFVMGVYFLTHDIRTIIALLIFTSPAELGLATPLVMVAGIARAAREGILLKGGVFLEELAHIDTIIFDKTGTLTIGKPVVTDVEILNEKYTRNEAVQLAAAADRRSNHPLAQAIVDHANNLKVPIPQPTSFNTIKGCGVEATVAGKRVELGNDALLRDKKMGLPRLKIGNENSTAVFLLINNNLVAILYLTDKLREGAREAIQALKKGGVRKMIMLTGDNSATAEFIAKEVGLSDYQAGLLPEDKISFIKEIQAKEKVKVAMVGDGINDAPALAQANVGIAMGVMGNQAAMDAADIVLIGDDLKKIAKARALSKRAYRTIKENIFIGVGVVHVFGIILVLAKIIGPIEAAAIHLVPDVLVFLNSTKLLRVNIG
ncbi:cadmium-translocating P-type ATPase [Candidatus Saganbacteria bacterium]|nr:cadmium-translocating P-type ATPase [Candidatus Saganbacteria bacterium]